MIVEESFYRPPELSREPRTLPAETYNLAHLLLKRAATGCLFVPLRGMQFLAVLDNEEFIFVDREGRRMIELAWQHFAPQTRHALDEPVSYEAVYTRRRVRRSCAGRRANSTRPCVRLSIKPSFWVRRGLSS